MSQNQWWRNAVFYELYVDTFADTFLGLIAKLDYLQKLGITAIHILPHYPSPMHDAGYDVLNYCAVRPKLGTIEDFQKFTKEATRAVYLF